MFEGPVLGVVIMLLFIIMIGIVAYYQWDNRRLSKAIDGFMIVIAMQSEVIEELKREKDFKKNNNIKAD